MGVVAGAVAAVGLLRWRHKLGAWIALHRGDRREREERFRAVPDMLALPDATAIAIPVPSAEKLDAHANQARQTTSTFAAHANVAKTPL